MNIQVYGRLSEFSLGNSTAKSSASPSNFYLVYLLDQPLLSYFIIVYLFFSKLPFPGSKCTYLWIHTRCLLQNVIYQVFTQ